MRRIGLSPNNYGKCCCVAASGHSEDCEALLKIHPERDVAAHEVRNCKLFVCYAPTHSRSGPASGRGLKQVIDKSSLYQLRLDNMTAIHESSAASLA